MINNKKMLFVMSWILFLISNYNIGIDRITFDQKISSFFRENNISSVELNYLLSKIKKNNKKIDKIKLIKNNKKIDKIKLIKNNKKHDFLEVTNKYKNVKHYNIFFNLYRKLELMLFYSLKNNIEENLNFLIIKNSQIKYLKTRLIE